MDVWTLTVETDRNTVTQVFNTDEEVYRSLRNNFDTEGRLSGLDDTNMIQSLIDNQGLVIYIESHQLRNPDLYEKCLHCHLFVEPNSSRTIEFDNLVKAGLSHRDAENAVSDIAEFSHLSRGDEADERFEDHEPRPSGMVANLATWQIFGPSLMRERFYNKDLV